MSIRTNHARTLSDEETIVTNSHLVQSIVTDYTLRDTLYGVECEVGVAYSSDMKLVTKVLLRVARAVAWREPSRDPAVLLRGFGGSAVNFAVSV